VSAVDQECNEDNTIKARLNRELRIQKESTVLSIPKLKSGNFSEITIQMDKYLWYLEEYLDGPDLEEEIKKNNLPNLKELLSLMFDIFKAIEYLWSKKIIHRDIKPANIKKVITDNLRFVLLDAGYALALRERSLTREGGRPGTLKYMSPEQIDVKKKRDLDFRSDFYSFGVSIYEYATGIHPYIEHDDSDTDMIVNILYKTPKEIQNRRTDLPSDLCKIVNGLLSKPSHLRPNSFKKIFDNLVMMKENI